MNHLTPDELIDAVEETLTAARRAHLTECPRCGAEVAQLAAILQESRVVGHARTVAALLGATLESRPHGDCRRIDRPALGPLVPVAGPRAAGRAGPARVRAGISAVAGGVPVPPVQVAVNGTDAQDAVTVVDGRQLGVRVGTGGRLDVETAREAGIAVAGQRRRMAMHLIRWSRRSSCGCCRRNCGAARVGSMSEHGTVSSRRGSSWRAWRRRVAAAQHPEAAKRRPVPRRICRRGRCSSCSTRCS